MCEKEAPRDAAIIDLPPKNWSKEAVSEVGLRAYDNCV